MMSNNTTNITDQTIPQKLHPIHINEKKHTIPVKNYITVLGKKTHYVLWGSSRITNELVVLVHGYTQSSQCWDALGPIIAKHHMVLAFDFFGCGRSDPISKNYELNPPNEKFFARQIHELLLELCFENKNIILVGTSLGGIIGTAFTNLYPEKVKKLILISPGGIPTNPMEVLLSPFTFGSRCLYWFGKTPVVGEATVELVRFVIQNVLYGLLNMATIEETENIDTVRRYSKVFAEKTLEFTNITHTEIIDWTFSFDHNEHYISNQLAILRHIPMIEDLTYIFKEAGQNSRPILLIFGTQDRIVPLSNANLLKQFMPKAKLLHVEGGGHGCYSTHTEVVGEAILNFIAQCEEAVVENKL